MFKTVYIVVSESQKVGANALIDLGVVVFDTLHEAETFGLQSIPSHVEFQIFARKVNTEN